MQFIKDTFQTFWNLVILSIALVFCLILVAAISFACAFGVKLGIQVSQSDVVQQYVLTSEE